MSGAQRGQGIVEYGLILALSAVVAVVVLVFFGGTLSAVLEAIGEAIEACDRERRRQPRGLSSSVPIA